MLARRVSEPQRELDAPFPQQHRTLAQTLDGRCVMRHEHDRAPAPLEVEDLPETLPLKCLVADCKHLVEQKYVCGEMRSDREAEPHEHPGRVGANRQVDELLEPRERDDPVE